MLYNVIKVEASPAKINNNQIYLLSKTEAMGGKTIMSSSWYKFGSLNDKLIPLCRSKTTEELTR
jgi:hypothetical protein